MTHHHRTVAMALAGATIIGAALAWAAWRIYGRSAQTQAVCETDRVCQPVSHTVRTWFWLVLLIALVPLLVPLAAPWFY